jgi:hypothetical protein
MFNGQLKLGTKNKSENSIKEEIKKLLIKKTSVKNKDEQSK